MPTSRSRTSGRRVRRTHAGASYPLPPATARPHPSARPSLVPLSHTHTQATGASGPDLPQAYCNCIYIHMPAGEPFCPVWKSLPTKVRARRTPRGGSNAPALTERRGAADVPRRRVGERSGRSGRARTMCVALRCVRGCGRLAFRVRVGGAKRLHGDRMIGRWC
ncbi:hypothetical protein PYCCODRAFT_617925 [Trametes coccinea BRFM310]|uniref:Uncharacterized protein n=1 Tax=Trametes coccinea (strain BRFM310) TaxID=1353009 RepID=A0A1Y2J4X4_TRAC3|nr:hypothetical protein PYCCODRAFT_617925 [Trametes coccinea BRFM310]